MQGERLFSQNPLSETLTDLTVSMQDEVKSYPEDQFLNTAASELKAYFLTKYRANPIVLHEDRREMESQDGTLVMQGPSPLTNRPGTTLTETTFLAINIPYEGKKRLFYLRPSEWDNSPPFAEITNSHVRIHVAMLSRSADELTKHIDDEIAKIRLYAQRQATEMLVFNDRLRDSISQAVESRKQRLVKEKGVMTSLGIPIKHRDGATAVPVERNISVGRLKASSNQSHPHLDMAVYDDILKVLQRMAEVLERSPEAFVNIDEEHLRWHFVIQLNGSYTVGATGETFNAHGKSDIFLRWEGGNVFIAECKFWHGKKEFVEIYDQLFQYTTWRDTKVAILLFNRNKDFSAVVTNASEAARSHKSFKRALPFEMLNGFRGVYGHPEDGNREVIVTCLCFDVPI